MSVNISTAFVQQYSTNIMMLLQQQGSRLRNAVQNYSFVGKAASMAEQFGSVTPSYKPGVKLGDLAPSLPAYAIEAIREALPAFGKKIKGFDMADAVLTGVETRTSSPLKMPRGENLQSTNVHGLYPAGEGASYAGGILSAGVDGIRVAEAVAMAMLAPVSAV